MVILFLVACAKSGAKTVATRPRPTPLPTSTPLPPLPTLPPAGSSDNPIVFLFVHPGGSSVKANGDALAQALSDETKLVIQVKSTPDYGVARRALCNGSAAVISANAFAYLSAIEQNCGDGLYTAEVDSDVTSQGEMLAGLGRDIFTVKGFAGYRFCRPDSLSIDGWITPSLSLKTNGINPLSDLDSVIDSGSDEGVVKDIIALKCDVGAARLGAEKNVPGSKAVLVIDKLPPVPNDTLMVSSRLDGRVRGLLEDTLRNHLDDMSALIGATNLVAANDKNFDGLRQLFDSANVDVLSMGN